MIALKTMLMSVCLFLLTGASCSNSPKLSSKNDLCQPAKSSTRRGIYIRILQDLT